VIGLCARIGRLFSRDGVIGLCARIGRLFSRDGVIGCVQGTDRVVCKELIGCTQRK
jgi:hypothetical protein